MIGYDYYPRIIIDTVLLQVLGGIERRGHVRALGDDLAAVGDERLGIVDEQLVLRVDSPAKAYLRSLAQHTVYVMMVPFALLSVLPLGIAMLFTLPGFAYAAVLPVGWSVTAVKEFFQSFSSVQGREYEFHAV